MGAQQPMSLSTLGRCTCLAQRKKCLIGQTSYEVFLSLRSVNDKFSKILVCLQDFIKICLSILKQFIFENEYRLLSIEQKLQRQ